MFIRIRNVFILFFLSVIQLMFGQSDTIHYYLQNVEIQAPVIQSPIKGDITRTLHIDMNWLNEMPKIMGNADPMRYTQLLPGVLTNSEYDAGLYMQGCENGHNQISIGQAPIYNAAHLFGLFSVFNGSHFKSLVCTQSNSQAISPNRLGGIVNMESYNNLSEKVNGECSIGPISSQATLRLKAGTDGILILSARKAYLNLIYHNLLTIDGSKADYDFSDYNLSYQLKLNRYNTIWTDAYWGNDDFGFNENNYETQTSLKWGNKMASFHWLHDRHSLKWENMIYFTSYSNKMNLSQPFFQVDIPSSIQTGGIKSTLNKGNFTYDANVLWHTISPQAIINKEVGNKSTSSIRQHATEYTLAAQYSRQLSSRWSIIVGLKGSCFSSEKNHFVYGIDPSVNISYVTGSAEWCVRYASISQYLFLNGFSNANLPTEFWYACNKEYKPQKAHSGSLSYNQPLFNGTYKITAELYYKHLSNQLEYNSDIYQLITSSDASLPLLSGNGFNYGLNLLFQKRKGKITGWISYSLGRALRRFDSLANNKLFPSNHERIHELNAVANYSLGKHWTFGTTMVVASGTPFTAPTNAYLINNSIITQYGEHNANRLKTYFRIDSSVNYMMNKKKSFEHGINLSFYNITGYSNELLYRLKIYDNHFAYRPLKFAIKTLPSINYYLKF